METKNRRLKILFLPTWYPSEKNAVWGIFIKEHAKAVSLYDDVVVLCSEGCGKDVKGLYEVVSDRQEDGIRTIRTVFRKISIPKVTYFVYLWSIFATFRRLLKQGWRPDIIHAHIFPAAVPAVLIGRIYKTPVVVSEHWSAFPRHLLGKLDIAEARFGMNRANIVITVSKNLEEAIKSYKIENRFEVVPNVVDTQMFYPPALGKDNKKRRLLFVGLLTPVKGIPFLLKALAHLKQKRSDFILDIVGDGPNRREYEELTGELGLGEIVKFHGLKTKDQIAEFMRQCHFFVLPSLWENLPCVLIEAMASGLPVIASKVGGIPEIVNEESGILIPSENADKLAEGVDYMLDCYQNYSVAKISGYAKGRFSYETVGRKLDDVYKWVTYEKKPGR